MVHSSQAANTSPCLGYPSSELLLLIPTINPFITQVAAAPDRLHALRETNTYAAEMLTQDRIVSDSRGFGRFFERLKRHFRPRSH